MQKRIQIPLFGIKPNATGKPKDLNEVICRLCKQVVPAKDTNTTNLHEHLLMHHPDKYATLTARAAAPSTAATGKAPLYQHKFLGAFANPQKYEKASPRWAQCTLAVSRYLVKDMMSYHSVERESFKELLNTFDKQCELPGQKYFSKTT